MEKDNQEFYANFTLIQKFNFSLNKKIPCEINTFLVLIPNEENLDFYVDNSNSSQKVHYLFNFSSSTILKLDFKFQIRAFIIDYEIFEHKYKFYYVYQSFGVYNLSFYIQEFNLNLTRQIQVQKVDFF